MQKERYFPLQNIQDKAQELLTSVEFLRSRHNDLAFFPEKAALLVLDMQQYFLDENSHAFIPSAPAIIEGINTLISVFATANRPVIATRHMNTKEDAGMMSKWWRDLINSQDAYSHYDNKLNLSKYIPINKTQYDAFLQTTLAETLQALQIEQVVISGVMTHLCCETTARSAFMRGFEVFFTVDGTATYNEALHRASLLTLSHGFVIPVTVGEILVGFE